MLIELCNLGRDAELRYTPSNKPVCNLALAYSVGFGDNKKTQWLDGSLWGDRAEKLVEHLTKGTKVMIYGDDVHTETYQKNGGGEGHKLRCRIVDIKFAGSPTAAAQQPQQTPPQAQQQPQADTGGFDRFDDDIPF